MPGIYGKCSICFSVNKCLPFTNFTLTSPNNVSLILFPFIDEINQFQGLPSANNIQNPHTELLED